jgi:hypothetical protein
MSESNIDGWTIEKEQEDSILLTSPSGEIAANRWKVEGAEQTWIIDVELEHREPMSWEVQVQSRGDLLTRSIPELLNERLPENEKHKEN